MVKNQKIKNGPCAYFLNISATTYNIKILFNRVYLYGSNIQLHYLVLKV
jgi:hypothetical protein